MLTVHKVHHCGEMVATWLWSVNLYTILFFMMYKETSQVGSVFIDVQVSQVNFSKSLILLASLQVETLSELMCLTL